MLINPQDIKDKFRVEESVSNTILERHIDLYEELVKDEIGSDAWQEITEHPEDHQTEIAMIVSGGEYFVVAQLIMKENIVSTAFGGGYVKKDEFSEIAPMERCFSDAKRYEAYCSRKLRELCEFLGKKYDFSKLADYSTTHENLI